MSISVFVEGGGPYAKTRIATACRKAFRVFFGKVLGDRPKPRIIASGSRNEAYRDFCRSLENDPDTFPVLLVDSEDAVPAGKTAKAHLRDRDHWTNTMPDEQVHLMVQCMEAWFLADKPALAHYYGGGFRESALPGNLDIEEISKQDVMNGLAHATTDTSKRQYHKTKHGFEILERIDPVLVRQQSGHAEALFGLLLAKLT